VLVLLTFHGLRASMVLHRRSSILARTAWWLRMLTLLTSPRPNRHSWLQADSERAG
jgi:hypothetical protein